MIPSVKELRALVESADGLRRLVAGGAVEHDHLDFKVTYNQKDPKYPDEVRKDCAGLATTGEGFLVIGVEESGDGEDRAKRLVGLPIETARALKTSVAALLEGHIDPPFGPTEKLVRLVSLTNTTAAVVARLRGKRGYPKSVTTEKGEQKYLIRVGSNNQNLSVADARVRRRDLDQRRLLIQGVIAAAMVFALVATFLAVKVGQQDAKLRQQDTELESAKEAAAMAMKARGAVPPRRLTPEQQDVIARNISGHPHTVSVESTVDLEPQAYADYFKAVFQRAGWTVVPPNFALLTRVAPNVRILVHNIRTAPIEAVILQRALKNAGIEANGGEVGDHVQDGGIDLFIGPQAP
jgi:hypothetical protein